MSERTVEAAGRREALHLVVPVGGEQQRVALVDVDRDDPRVPVERVPAQVGARDVDQREALPLLCTCGHAREAQAALSLPASMHCEDGPGNRRPADGLQRLIGFMLLLERCCSANPPITRISSFATRLQHARSLD